MSPAVSPAVPLTLDDITVAWLAEVFATVPSVAGVPLGFRTERIGESTGFLGVLARLHLRWDRVGAGPDTVVVKLPTLDPGGRAVGEMLDVWNREAGFYREVASLCAAAVPTCLHIGSDPPNGRWVLVLEDCGPANPVDQISGATEEQAGAAIDALAGFQAPFWGRTPPVDWLPGFHRPRFDALTAAMTGAIPSFVDQYGDRVPSRTIDWLRAFVAVLPRWAADVASGPLTLVHADYRLDNLLFDADDRVTIIDWQTALWGPGPMDLASFLGTSLTVEQRRNSADGLMARYGSALVDQGVTVTMDRLRHVSRGCLLWWMAIFANNLARIDPTDARGTALFDTMIERTFRAADDEDAGRLLGDDYGSSHVR